MGKYVKTFENFTVDKYLKLKLYSVQYWEHNSNVKIVYYGSDYDEAKLEMESFNTNDLDNDIKGEKFGFKDVYYIVVDFQVKEDIYEWVGNNYDDEINIEDYPIEEYYNDENFYLLIKEGEYETIDSKNVETPESVNNREEKELEDSLENEVIDYVKSITSENKFAAFLNSTFYALKEYKDGFVMIRVADHFFNIDNVRLGRNVVYDYIEGMPEYTKHKNIYGFISINILNKDSSDRKGFRRDFRDWIEDNPNLASLVDYIDLDISKSEDYYIDWKEELENSIEYMEDNINKALHNGIFDDID